jgi:hypothetical protein
VRRWAGYLATCLAVVAGTVWMLDRFLAAEQKTGLRVAAVAALTLQVAAFAARLRWGTTPTRLLATWVWSTGARFTAVLAMGIAAWRYEALDPVTSLVGLAGFLFAMLLLEPVFFRPGRPDSMTSNQDPTRTG